MSVRADRPATGRGRLMLLPGLCRLWRDETALQLGADPARAVIIDLPDQRSARVLDLLDGSRTEHGILRDARAMNILPEVTRALLAALRAANLVIGADMLMPPSLPEGARRRLLSEAVARAMAARTLDLPPSGWIFRDEPDDPGPASRPDSDPGQPDDPVPDPTNVANAPATESTNATSPANRSDLTNSVQVASPTDSTGLANRADTGSLANPASPPDSTDLSRPANGAGRPGLTGSTRAASPADPTDLTNSARVASPADSTDLVSRAEAVSLVNPTHPVQPTELTGSTHMGSPAGRAGEETSADSGGPEPNRVDGSPVAVSQDHADAPVGNTSAGSQAVGRGGEGASTTAERSTGNPRAKPAPITPAEAMRRRAAASVQVVGTSRLVVPIACTLARAGVGHVDPALTGRVEVYDEAIGGLTPADTDRPRATAASEAVLRVAPYTDTRALRTGTATFVVQVGQGVPAELAAHAYARRALPHLLIEERDDTVLIGPLVPPHGSPCLRCLDLHRRDRDPAWPTLIAQLATTGDGGSTVATTTTIIAVGVAAAQVLGYIDGDEVPTIGASIEVGPPSTLRRRSWSAHPRCECAHRVRGAAPGRPSRRPGPRRM